MLITVFVLVMFKGTIWTIILLLDIVAYYVITSKCISTSLSGQLSHDIMLLIISAVQEKYILRYRDTNMNLKQKARGYQTANMWCYLAFRLFYTKDM